VTEPSRPAVSVDDPVVARRRQIERWNDLAKRVGYLCFLAALIVFFIGIATTFNSAVSTIVIALIIVGSVLLAPSLVIGYGLKAADREDGLRPPRRH
jgi:uncharacterized membrane protein